MLEGEWKLAQAKAVRYRFLLGPFMLYLPLGIVFCIWAWSRGTLAPAIFPVLVVLGVVCWTFIEYLLHRFVLHYHAQIPAIRNVIEKLHLGHHRDPMDEAKISVPVYASLPIAVALLGLLRLMGGSWEVSALSMTGIIIGYLSYEAVHFRIHCGSKGRGLIGFQRTYHFVHHYQHPTRCFGVTTPVWDWAFGTRRGKPQAQTLDQAGIACIVRKGKE